MPPKSVKSKSVDSEVKQKSSKSTKSKDSVSLEDLEKPTEKTPTKTTKKVTKKEEPVKEHSESEQSESEHSESEHSESEHSESEHSDNDVMEQKDKQDKQDWNAQLSDDEQQNDVKVTKHATYNLDRPQYKSKRFNNNSQKNFNNNSQKNFNNKFERKPNVNKLSKALKFSYDDYEHVANPVHEVSSEDLLRVVVARSYKEGQMTLKRCLETVLRAMNHECNFPSLPKHNNFHNSEKQEKEITQ